MSDKKYEIIDDYDEVFDERGNTFLALRKISWFGKEPKLDLRKYYIDKDGEEKADKGFCFLTEEGPNELTKTLVDRGYGDTIELMESLSKREDFNHEKYNIEEIVSESKEDYYDPNSLIMGEDI